MTSNTNRLDGAMMTDEQILELAFKHCYASTAAGGFIFDRERGHMLKFARALLSASKPAVAPEGWKLVPVDPTELMAMAPHTALVKFNPSTVMGHPVMEVARECYRSMLAASPQPVAQPAQSRADVLEKAAVLCDQLAGEFPGGAADLCAKTLRRFNEQLDKQETRQ